MEVVNCWQVCIHTGTHKLGRSLRAPWRCWWHRQGRRELLVLFSCNEFCPLVFQPQTLPAHSRLSTWKHHHPPPSCSTFPAHPRSQRDPRGGHGQDPQGPSRRAVPTPHHAPSPAVLQPHNKIFNFSTFKGISMGDILPRQIKRGIRTIENWTPQKIRIDLFLCLGFFPFWWSTVKEKI